MLPQCYTVLWGKGDLGVCTSRGRRNYPESLVCAVNMHLSVCLLKSMKVSMLKKWNKSWIISLPWLLPLSFFLPGNYFLWVSVSPHSIQTDSARAFPEMAPFLCHFLEPSLLLLQLNKPSFTSVPTMPVLPPANEAASECLCWMGEAASGHLKVKQSLALVPWGSTSRVQEGGKPRQGTNLAENYSCLLAQLSGAPGAWSGSPVTCTNIRQKKEVYGKEWPQKYMWRAH